MLNYSGPVYHATEQDRRGEFLAQGTKDFAAGLAGGIDKISTGIAKSRQKAEETRAENDFLTEQWNAVKHQIDPQGQDPWMLDQDQKFTSGSLSARRGIVTGTMAGLDRTTKMLQQQQDMALRASGEGRAWALANHSMDPKNKLPQSYTTPGGGTAIVSANGAVTPEGEFLPQEPDTGEWRDMPGMPNYLGHWTPKRGFTGASIPKPKDANAALPQLKFVYDEQTKRGAYMDDSGDIVDPKKLVEYQDVPGTGQPSMRMPMPPIPGVPPGLTIDVPGTGQPAEKRPVFRTPAGAQKAQIITGPQGTVRTKPDGSEEFLQWDAKGIPSWQQMTPPANGPSTDLLPMPDQVSGQNLLKLLNN